MGNGGGVRRRGIRVGKKHSPMVGVERSKIVDVENLGIEKTEESGDEKKAGEDRCWGLNKGNAELSMGNREWLWYEKWDKNGYGEVSVRGCSYIKMKYWNDREIE